MGLIALSIIATPESIAGVFNEGNRQFHLTDDGVFHEINTNGIGYVDLMFDLSGVPAKELPYVGILQSVLGIIDTANYEYGALFNEINMHTGGIGTSLELYNNVTKVKEKELMKLKNTSKRTGKK